MLYNKHFRKKVVNLSYHFSFGKSNVNEKRNQKKEVRIMNFSHDAKQLLDAASVDNKQEASPVS